MDTDRCIVDEIEKLNLETQTINASNPAKFAEVLDEYTAVLKSYQKQIIFVAFTNALEYTYPASEVTSQCHYIVNAHSDFHINI